MLLILDFCKKIINGIENDDSFDEELLLWINAYISTLSIWGVTEFTDLSVDETTPWPTFENVQVGNLCKSYLLACVRSRFDPSPNGTISKSEDNNIQATLFQISVALIQPN